MGEEEEAARVARIRAMLGAGAPDPASPIAPARSTAGAAPPVYTWDDFRVDPALNPAYADPAPPAQAPPAAPVLRQAPQAVSEPGAGDRILPGGGGFGTSVPARTRFNQATGTFERLDPSGAVVEALPIPPGASLGDAAYSLLTADERAGLQLPVRSAPPTSRRVPPGGALSVRLQTTEQGPVSAGTQHRQEAAQAGLEAAQHRVDLDEQAALQRRAEAQLELARAQQLEAQAEAAREAERQAGVATRMAAFDRSIQDVAAGRVDPEGFFGGDFGRRLGAAVSVALGQLGSLLGGGENVALGIINSAIDRNLRAQEVNLAQGRAAAGLQGQALAQYRSLLADDRVARDAARAAHLAAIESELAGRIASAAPAQLAGIQTLRDRVAEARAAAEQAAREQAEVTISRDIQATQRVPARLAAQAAEGAFGQHSLAQAIRGLPPEEQQALLAREAARERISAATGVRRRRAGRPHGRAAPAPATSAASMGQLSVTPEELADMRAQARTELSARAEASAPDLETGGVFAPTGRGGPAQFRDFWRSTGEDNRNRVLQIMSATRQANDLHDRLRALSAEGASLTDPERATRIRAISARLQALAQNNLIQTGVINSPAELERLQQFMPNLTGRSFQEIAPILADAEAAMDVYLELMNENADAMLGVMGAGVRTVRAGAAHGERMPPLPGQPGAAPASSAQPASARSAPAARGGAATTPADAWRARIR